MNHFHHLLLTIALLYQYSHYKVSWKCFIFQNYIFYVAWSSSELFVSSLSDAGCTLSITMTLLSTSILYFISPQVYNTKPDSSGQQNVTTHEFDWLLGWTITCQSFVHSILVILHFDWFDHTIKGVDSIKDSLTRLSKCFDVTSIV